MSDPGTRPVPTPQWLTNLMRFMSHFPMRTRDVSALVLKGHLLTEELLRDFLKRRMTTPQHLLEARLQYRQCIFLARALTISPQSWVWPGLEQLNTIRNKLSHALEPTKLDETVNQFVRLAQRHVPDGKFPEEMHELWPPIGLAIFTLYSELSGQLTPETFGRGLTIATRADDL
jgi:hypothetical protein